jgi:hypothetical protein
LYKAAAPEEVPLKVTEPTTMHSNDREDPSDLRKAANGAEENASKERKEFGCSESTRPPPPNERPIEKPTSTVLKCPTSPRDI